MSDPLFKKDIDKVKLEYLIIKTIHQIVGAVGELDKHGIYCSFPEDIKFTTNNVSFTIKIK